MDSYIDQAEDAVGLGMTPDELESHVQQAVRAAETYIDSEIAPAREKAQKYYRGEKIGGEEDGRSQFVNRDLQDVVGLIMPGLMRVFFGTDKAVEYTPRREDQIEQAEQATDYAGHIVLQDNPGYMEFQSAFKDGLYQKVGIIKWWWDTSVEVSTSELTGLQSIDAILVALEDGVEVVDWTENEDGTEDLTVRRRREAGRFKFKAIPPEEFLIDRQATCIDDAEIVAHRCLKTVSELVAMGYDQTMVEGYADHSSELSYNTERITRHRTIGLNDTLMQQRRVLYTECYIKVDYDGDGIAEVRRVCLMGPGLDAVENEPWDDIPFADFPVDPTPHAFWPSDLADKTLDIQRASSQVMRLVFDSLAQTVDPPMEVVETQVNINDVLNPEVSGIIRTRQPGMVRELDRRFNGQAAFPVLEMLQDVRNQRTGATKQAAGLNAEDLQSSTRVAVNATVQGAQQSLELIARNFAERGMKRFYTGLLRTVSRNQDEARVVRLRGKSVKVDPRAWDALMDVQVNVVIGAGMVEDRIRTLQEIAAAQKEALQTMGPNNPLVTLGQLSQTLTTITELSGFKQRFFNELPADFSPPPQEPKPDPAELLAQAQIAEIQARTQIDMLKIQADREDSLRNAALKVAELEAKYKTTMDKAVLDAQARLRGSSE